MTSHDQHEMEDRSEGSPSRRSGTESLNEIEHAVTHGPDNDDDPPPRGGAAARMSVPETTEMEAAIAAFIKASEGLSRAALNIQTIRYPLESLATSVRTLSEDMAQLRRNLTPPININ